ncbi:MAG: phosphatidate cytidylyltransferase [Symploca sp. SIO2C1]|nr:phosphatidate cytidylyltransferase [Symploca sp. SIO2C1]
MLHSLPWLEPISPLWLKIVIVALGLVTIVFLAETLHRYTDDKSELSRKIVHIGSGNVILIAWWLQIPETIGIAASLVTSAIALVSYQIPILPGINSVGRRSLGTFFYAVSIGVLIAWFWPIQQYQYAAIGILIMTWGDGLAGLIGQKWGKHRYQIWGIKKSWEGSLAMFLASYIVSSLILLNVQGNLWQTWLVPIAIALFATIVETFSKLGIDNLTVPLGSAALAFFLSQFLA